MILSTEDNVLIKALKQKKMLLCKNNHQWIF